MKAEYDQSKGAVFEMLLSKTPRLTIDRYKRAKFKKCKRSKADKFTVDRWADMLRSHVGAGLTASIVRRTFHEPLTTNLSLWPTFAAQKLHPFWSVEKN